MDMCQYVGVMKFTGTFETIKGCAWIIYLNRIIQDTRSDHELPILPCLLQVVTPLLLIVILISMDLIEGSEASSQYNLQFERTSTPSITFNPATRFFFTSFSFLSPLIILFLYPHISMNIIIVITHQ